MNTYAFRMKSGLDPTAADVLTLANAMSNISRPMQINTCTWNTWSFHQLWGSGMTTIQDECRRDGAKIVIGNFAAGWNGQTATGDVLPPQCAGVVTIGTGIAGRRRRGRSYLFGFVETHQAGGTWTSTWMTSVQNGLNTTLGLYGPSGTDPQFQLGVWSERRASGCWVDPSQGKLVNVETPHPEDAFTPATGFNLRSIVYTQRRRTLGVGR
jgi:hypothetical protein